MSFAPTITEADIFAALRAILLTILPAGTDVIRGQTNRVPEPTGPNFVVMTPGRRLRLSTNVETWDEPDPITIELATPTQYPVQLDVHGPDGTNMAQTIRTVMRSGWACRQMPATVQPLFADDPQQLPFMNGENQVEDRWVMNVHLQANPVISTPAEFADTLTVTTQPPADIGVA